LQTKFTFQFRLNHNDITSAGAGYLADALRFNTSLEDLDLRHNRVSDLGAASLCTSILAHPTISSLNLAHNEIQGTTPYTRIALRNMLRFNKTLTEFFIEENFTPTDSSETIGSMVNAITGAPVAAIGKLEWGKEIPVDEAVTTKLQANYARRRRGSRISGGTGALITESTPPPATNGNHTPSDTLDMGYAGYVEISMREITVGLQDTNVANITSLFLDHNTLFQIGQPVLQKLVNLRSLHLSHNRFETMPPSIKLLSNLTVLDLSHNRLTRVPKEIVYLVQLEELDLSFNSIYSVGRDVLKHFGRLSSLRRLALHRNFLTQVPQSLLAFAQLTYLNPKLILSWYISVRFVLCFFYCLSRDLTVTANPAIPLAKQKVLIPFSSSCFIFYLF
jgi:Leucine-rich repeat (LRR) protein